MSSLTKQTLDSHISSSSPGPVGTGQFIAGVGANTIVALLAVMDDMMKIANIYGKLLTDQLESQKTIASSLGDFAESQASNSAEQMKWQGWAQVAGGSLSAATCLGSLFSKPNMSSLDDEIQGAQNYRSYLEDPAKNADKVVSTNEESTEKEAFSDLKNRTSEDFVKAKDGVSQEDKDKMDLIKAEDEKLEELKTHYDKKVEDLDKRRMTIKNEHDRYWETVRQTANGLSSISQGVGTGYGSHYTRQAGTEEAAKDTANAALQTAQGIASQTRNETDTYLNKSSEVNQLVGAISNANKLPGS